MTFIIECFRAHNFFIALKKKKVTFPGSGNSTKKTESVFCLKNESHNDSLFFPSLVRSF